MLRDENAFQSYIHMHLDHLCAIVLHCMIQEMFIFTVATLSACVFFTVATLSACVYLRAAVEISSMIDDTAV